MTQTIGVIGLWHLGCVLCASWYKLGHHVVGFDYDESRVDKLNRGIPPLYEPNLAETINEGMNKRTLKFSTDIGSLSDCDFIFLSYDTPVNEDDSCDTSILEKSVTQVSTFMKDDAVLVVSSQSPVGFCGVLREKLQMENNSLELAYSPENLRLGEAIHCYLNPGHIILGAVKSETMRKCTELFSKIKAEIITMNLESAEMVKHGINSFLANSIVFSNQMADICEISSARIDHVVRGMKADPRIGSRAYLSPGIGFSGGTLGRDLVVLNQKNSESKGNAELFGLIYQLNQQRKYSILNRIEKLLGHLKGHTIGVLGLTYKPGTSTLRRSLPLEIVKLLTDKSCYVKTYDPKADFSELNIKPDFTIASSIEDVANSTDILILLTEWEDFKRYNWKNIPATMKKPLFFDTKNYLNENVMREFGFEYFSIGI